MLNRLLKEELISEKEYSVIRNSIKRKYRNKRVGEIRNMEKTIKYIRTGLSLLFYFLYLFF